GIGANRTAIGPNAVTENSSGVSDRRAVRILTWLLRSIRPESATPTAELPSACRTGARCGHRHACGCRCDRRTQYRATIARLCLVSAGGNNAWLSRDPAVLVQPFRLTMKLIQIGAKGDVQPFETG